MVLALTVMLSGAPCKQGCCCSRVGLRSTLTEQALADPNKPSQTLANPS